MCCGTTLQLGCLFDNCYEVTTAWSYWFYKPVWLHYWDAICRENYKDLSEATHCLRY
jgi:hypothetical protein